MNYEFDTKDLVCLALSSVVGVWYLLRKVSGPQLSLGGAGLRLGFGMQDHGSACAVEPRSPFLLFSALDCQQSLRAGVFPQWSGAAALEQRQHWLHLAWGPLHLRRLLGKQELSLGQMRVAAIGRRHVRGLVPLQRQHAGWT